MDHMVINVVFDNNEKIRTRNRIDCESEVRRLVLVNMHTKYHVMAAWRCR